MVTVSSRADQMAAEIQKKQGELTQLDKVIGEVNEYTAKRKELEDKLKVIDDLRKGKTGPVRALDDLASEIPNRIWLTKMDESGGSVTLEGKAIDHEDVSAFMKSLQKSRYFTSIVLGFSKSVKDASGATLYEFKITCAVDYKA
jgi:type IV pilus assembly protein PilN